MIISIQAQAIIVSARQVLMPGQIFISNGRVVALSQRTNDRPHVDLGDAVLLPGLINPHTHLEFSDLTDPLPVGSSFPDWIANVLAQRQASANQSPSRAAAIAAGLSESQAAGVVVLGDIVTMPWQPACIQSQVSSPTTESWIDERSAALLRPHLAGKQCKVIAFMEQLGLSPERRAAMMAWRDQLLDLDPATWPDRLMDLALSPHAPYSTPLEMWESVSMMARRQSKLLATHLLESPAEREWLDSGTGPMADMLSKFNAANWRQPKDFMQLLWHQLGLAKSALLIHGNYLVESELDSIARYPDRLNLVYCPRTHEHFQHQPYPMAAIRKRGIRLLLGTDSRSTNPDLNLWQEARTALRLHTCLRPSKALFAITGSPAIALDIDLQYGSLRPGSRAAFNVIRPTSSLPRNLEELLQELFATCSCPTPLASLVC